MADLPKERLSQEPPFTYCGIDMFGPILGVFSHIFQVEQFILNLQFHYLSMMISDELFLWYGWPTKDGAFFPVGIIVRDPHHRESPTRREQDLNLRRTWVQALMNEVVQ